MRLAGLGLRTGTYWRGHLPASLHGAEVAAHLAVEADQRGRSVWSPHCWITVLSWVLAPTVPGDDAGGTAAEGPQEGQHAGGQGRGSRGPVGWVWGQVGARFCRRASPGLHVLSRTRPPGHRRLPRRRLPPRAGPVTGRSGSAPVEAGLGRLGL